MKNTGIAENPINYYSVCIMVTLFLFVASAIALPISFQKNVENIDKEYGVQGEAQNMQASTKNRPETRTSKRISDFTVLDVIDKDTSQFTQGLLYHDGFLYEGTGLYGKSELRKIDPKTGGVLQSKSMERQYFGEGLTKVNNQLVQLTWKERTAFVYDFETFEEIKNFKYETVNGEGWGLAYNPAKHELIVSDGTEYLMFWDADTYELLRKVAVHTHDNKRIQKINELEYIDGKIWANIWFSDYILVIDEKTGEIEKAYDMSTLHPRAERDAHEDVLNGIAYDENENVVYLTGKLWTKYYKVSFEDLGPRR